MKCQHANMKPGIALQSTLVASHDEAGFDAVTMNYGGPGRLIRVMKCPECGHSVTCVSRNGEDSAATGQSGVRGTVEGRAPLSIIDIHPRLTAAFPDALVFVRVGDFFETLADQAREAAPVLGVALTFRTNRETGEKTPSCAFPVHGRDSAVKTLVDAGNTVLMVE